MNVLVVGDGERELTLCGKLARSPHIHNVQCLARVSTNASQSIGDTFDYVLVNDENGLGLRPLNSGGIVRVDFAQGKNTHRRLYGGGRGEMLARAIGLRRENIVPTVLDATAGLGKDAFVLATLGCSVRMCERNPLVHALLSDGLLRAATNNEDAEARAIVARMHLEEQDALLYLPTLADADRPDVIYLDPMFPNEGRRRSAVKKDMAAFHNLVGADADADELLPLALAKARYRVVVKRPRHAPPLADNKPSLTMEGDTTRFDIYPLRSMAKAVSVIANT